MQSLDYGSPGGFSPAGTIIPLPAWAGEPLLTVLAEQSAPVPIIWMFEPMTNATGATGQPAKGRIDLAGRPDAVTGHTFDGSEGSINGFGAPKTLMLGSFKGRVRVIRHAPGDVIPTTFATAPIDAPSEAPPPPTWLRARYLSPSR